MGLVTGITLPNNGDLIVVENYNVPLNAILSAINGNLDSANISSLSGAKLVAGTVPATAMDTNSNPVTRWDEAFANFLASGCVWTLTSGLTGAMTSGVAYVDGTRVVVSAVASKVFTASKDTYISVDASGTISYDEVANGAAIPTLASTKARVAKVITNGSTITLVEAYASQPVNSEKLGVTVAFHATSTMNIPDSSNTTVTTYTEVVDYGADFNHTTGVFTAPVAGFYHFETVMGCENIASGSDGRWQVLLRVNGTTKSTAFVDADSTTGDPAVCASVSLPLAAGDLVDVSVVNNTGGTEALNAYSFFSGYLVGRP